MATSDHREDPCAGPRQTERPLPEDPPVTRDHFASSEEFFEWLRDHIVEEGRLTEAEEETCELLLLGRNYLEIAAARRVSIETIKWHVKRILRKLGIGSTRELLWVVGYRIDRQDRD